MSVNIAFFQELLDTLAKRGRGLIPTSLFGSSEESIYELSRALLSGRGEASGVAIARELLDRYAALTPNEREAFFRHLAEELNPDPGRIAQAANRYMQEPDAVSLAALQSAVEAPRQEFFRRLNLAPGATEAIVAMRFDLLKSLTRQPELAVVDSDLRHLLQSWFNRGFLVLRRIDWQTPASILEKIIRYEAVHPIESWDDLRRRLDPMDRRCFAFFHPSLVDEPLIFVEVALMRDTPSAIQPVLAREERLEAGVEPTTAVFYSISNCQPGLKGISFGNFLLKQVVEELAHEKPTLETFVTLSPVPGFVRWLQRLKPEERVAIAPESDWAVVSTLKFAAESGAVVIDPAARPALLSIAAHYFLVAKGQDGKPVDSVARFHLGNGARLERLNWPADLSEKGMSEALGLMVNYGYDIEAIERNHEAFANEGTIVASRSVRALLKPAVKPKEIQARAPKLALPLPLPRGLRSGGEERS